MLRSLYHGLMFFIGFAIITFIGAFLQSIGVRHPESIVMGLLVLWITWSVARLMLFLHRIR